MTDERQYQDQLTALQQDHNRTVAEINNATAGASASVTDAARFMSGDVLASFGGLTEGLGMYAPLVYSGFRDVADSTQLVQDKARITADAFRERWAAMSESSIESAAAILQSAGQAAQGMGELNEGTKLAVAAIVSGFDGLSGETAEAGKQALMELLNSLGDPDAVTGGIDTTSASCQEIVDAIRENLDLASVSEERLAEYIASFGEASVVVQEEAQGLAEAATPPLYDMAGEMEDAGLNAGLGLAGGIRAAIGEVVAASNELAGVVPSSTRTLLGIRSPSRVMREMGRWVPAGLALGIDDGSQAVAASARSMAALAAVPVAAPAPAAPMPAASAQGALAGDEAVACLRFLADNLYSALSVSLDGRAVTRSVDERQGRLAALRARKGA